MLDISYISEKQKAIKEQVESLDRKIDKRPTLFQVISLATVGLTITVALFTFITMFLLGNQSEKIAAETKLVIVKEISNYGDREEIKWADRENTLINKVLAKLGLK